MSDTPARDTGIQLPVVTVLSASAGSGKTHALTMRFGRFLLSGSLPHASLRNLLAITFTNNAAREMRQKVLSLLKALALGDRTAVALMEELVDLREEELRRRARLRIGEIFDAYSEFRVRTIDSFMTTLFKSSAAEFGFHPDFDITIGTRALFSEVFALLSRSMASDPEKIGLLRELTNRLSDQRRSDDAFLWDPYEELEEEVVRLHRLLATRVGTVTLEDRTHRLQELERQIADAVNRLQVLVQESGLEPTKQFHTYREVSGGGDTVGLLYRAIPAKIVKRGRARKDALLALEERAEPVLAELADLLAAYAWEHAQNFFQPSVRMLGLVEDALARIKRERGLIFLDDVNKTLTVHLNQDLIAEIYFTLGDRIAHFLIDEFQDTSPIQWRNLVPLIENALAQGGSLFVVGDTKQSIYRFRGADWKIMKDLTATNPFPSAHHERKTLEVNYRSDERIVGFARDVFRTAVAESEYAEAAALSGLLDFVQRPAPDHEGKGYVEVNLCEQDEETTPQRGYILDVIRDCIARGYSPGDIAVLTQANHTVVEVSNWLNEAGIRFVSHSSLDIRKRKLTREIVAFLQFLDSPVDDMAFATFLLSDLLRQRIAQDKTFEDVPDVHAFLAGARTSEPSAPLYKAFERVFPDLWQKLCEPLFRRAGFLPLYDLLSELYRTFRVFDAHPPEEATLVRLLEVVQRFHESGRSSIASFLEFVRDEEDETFWELAIPEGMDAVRVMTIHKAKGLGFPVVVVLLHDLKPGRSAPHVLEEDGRLTLLKINRDLAAKNTRLNEIYEQHRLDESVDELNRLYVALTRAEQEMYIVGIHGETKRAPTMFLPDSPYRLGERRIVDRPPGPPAAVLETHHATELHLPGEISPRRLTLDEVRRGTLMHEVLARIGLIKEDVAAAIEEALAGTDIPAYAETTLEEVRRALGAFLAEPDVGEYFRDRPGRRVLNEQEIVSASGNLFRIDRLVMDEEKVSILDFKTGGDEEEAGYRQQVARYRDIAAELFAGRPAEGVIAYVDLRRVTRVP